MFHGKFYVETEVCMFAIQDQVTCTRNYRKLIHEEQTESQRYRRCTKCTETIHHVTVGCSPLAATEFTGRHGTIAGPNGRAV